MHDGVTSDSGGHRCRAVLVAFVCLSLCLAASAEVACTVTTFPTAADIRSRSTYIAIRIDDTTSLNAVPAGDLQAKAIDITSREPSLGSLTIQALSVYRAERPYEIGVTFSQLPSFVLGNESKVVSITLDQMFFDIPDQCRVSITIAPSPGSIATDSVTLSYFEIDINARNAELDLVVKNDFYRPLDVASLVVVSPNPLPYMLQFTVRLVDVSTLRFTILQNVSLNIPSTSSDAAVTVTLPPSLMETNLSPLIGATQVDHFVVVLKPSVPQVRVAYTPSTAVAVFSNDLWDGTASVNLTLLGDAWKPNATLWTQPDTKPTYVVVPFQPNGFDYLMSRSVMAVTFVTDRVAALTWTPCFGFAVTSLQTISIGRWGGLTEEGIGDVDFSLNIAPASALAVNVSFHGGSNMQLFQRFDTPLWVSGGFVSCYNVSVLQAPASGGPISSMCTPPTGVCPLNNCVNSTDPEWCTNSAINCTISASVNCSTFRYVLVNCTERGEYVLGEQPHSNASRTLWYSSRIRAFANMTEFDIRKRGINITVVVSRDIVSPSLTAAALRGLFTANSTSSGLFLSTELVSFVTINATAVLVVIPPQPSYNINSEDVIIFTAGPELLGSGSTIGVSQLIIIVTPVPTPVCVFPTSTILSAAAIRTKAPATPFDILVLGDSFCDLGAVRDVVVPAITSTRGLLTVTLNATYVNASAVRFLIQQLPSYAINAPDFVTIPMTSSAFCSLEVCTVPANPNTPNVVQVTVRPSAGVLHLRLPTVNELFPRTTDIVATVVLVDDIMTQESFFPVVTATTALQDRGRGFAASFVANSRCVVRRNALNFSLAVLTCTANASYDISVTESVRIVISRDVVSSREAPEAVTFVTPLVVTPVQGSIVASIDPVTALNESNIISGGVTARFTLQYDRWNATAAVANNLRGNFPASTTPDSDFSTVQFLRAFLSDAAFSLRDNGETLVVVFQPLPDYDIRSAEVFALLFDGVPAVLSGITPLNRNFTFVVSPSPTFFVANGSALLFGVAQLLTSRLTLTLRLFNDYWLREAAFNAAELCPMTVCVATVDSTGRFLTVSLDPNPEFIIAVDTAFPIVLRRAYVLSNITPNNTQRAAMRAYVTAGLLTWSGPTVVSESSLRTGTAGSYFAALRGDLFSSALDARNSLVEMTHCDGPMSDWASFCRRLPQLLHPLSVKLQQSRRVAVFTFAPDTLLDVFATQQVTLRLGRLAVESRVAPLNEYTVSVVPVAGAFYVSGVPEDLNANDLAGGPSARTIRLRIHLVGDRFHANMSRTVGAIASSVVVQGGPRPASLYTGFAALAKVLLVPDGAILSDDSQTLTLTIVPSASYLSDADELVTLTVPPAALLSGLNASGTQNQFSVAATAATVTVFPLQIRASELRTTRVSLLVSIATGGTWEQSFVQVGRLLVAGIECSVSLVEEPYGCTRHRAELLQSLQAVGATINGSTLVLELDAAPSYDILQPETIVLSFTRNWTTSYLPVTPSRLSVLVVPDPATVYAVVSMSMQTANRSALRPGASSVESEPPQLPDLNAFKQSAARWLSIPVSIIEVMSCEATERLGGGGLVDGRRFATVGFRIRNLVSDTPYYSVELPLAFVSLAPAVPITQPTPTIMHWTTLAQKAAAGYSAVYVSHAIIFGYLSSSPPADVTWNYLATGEVPDTSLFTFPLSPIAVFGIVVGVVAVIGLVVLPRRAALQRVMQGGLMRASKLVREAKVIVDDDADESEPTIRMAQEREDDEKIFSGQRTQDHQLSQANGLRAGAAPSILERDVPILLYAGQKRNAADNKGGTSPRFQPTKYEVNDFLVSGGYRNAQVHHELLTDETTGSPAVRRAHIVTRQEAKLAQAAVAAGMANSARREGDVIFEEEDFDDPFAHVVYPEWSKSRPGAFHPPSKFDEMWKEL